MRILVVDDDPIHRNLTYRTVSASKGREVVEAENGAHAWWRLTEPEERFHLAIIDVGMPLVTGIDLLKRMRRDARFATLPVLLVTGTSDRHTVAEAGALGVSGFLVKPFNAATLAQKIVAIETQLYAA
jgi:two-component system chemotaxis response regulator CheY